MTWFVSSICPECGEPRTWYQTNGATTLDPYYGPRCECREIRELLWGWTRRALRKESKP